MSCLCSSYRPVVENRARARRPRARRLQLRDVPRRKRREDLHVERQRPQPRSMDDLRPRREPRFLHLSRAEEGQGAAHDRKSVEEGKSGSVSVDLGGRRSTKNKKKQEIDKN